MTCAPGFFYLTHYFIQRGSSMLWPNLFFILPCVNKTPLCTTICLPFSLNKRTTSFPTFEYHDYCYYEHTSTHIYAYMISKYLLSTLWAIDLRVAILLLSFGRTLKCFSQ